MVACFPHFSVLVLSYEELEGDLWKNPQVFFSALRASWWLSSFPIVLLHRREMILMPRKPKKPCKHSGCPKLTDGNYCEEHAPLYQRASAASRGYDGKWRRARSRFLKAHPLCVCCQQQGRLVKATVVDHIAPHRGNETLFWEESNWQPLCKHCHDVKTMTEDRYPEYGYDR